MNVTLTLASRTPTPARIWSTTGDERTMTNFEVLRQILETANSALRDPASNPIVALLSLAGIALVLLLAILGLYLVVLSFERRPKDERAPDEVAVKKTRSARSKVLAIVLALVAVTALATGWTYSGLDRACTKCHFTSRAVESHSKGSHAEVACQSCHIGSGVSDAVLARMQGIQNAFAQLTGSASDGPVSARVRNSSCLACHEDIAAAVITARSIKIRHADILATGRACTDCHNTEGHGYEVRRALYPTMNDCLLCHDGTRAPSECGTCHSEDVGVAVRRLQRPLKQENVEKEDCRGCHSMDPCIECHGLELPHSDEFVNGFHARKAFLQPNVCRTCHSTKVFCNSCHRFTVTPNDPAPWARKHANVGDFVTWHSQAKDIGLGSCSCHDNDRQKFCNYCHGPQPER